MTGSEIRGDRNAAGEPAVAVGEPAIVAGPAASATGASVGAVPGPGPVVAGPAVPIPPLAAAPSMGRERGSRGLLLLALIAGVGVGAALWALLGQLAFPTFAANIPIERANVQLGTLLIHVGLVLAVIAFVPQMAFWLANLAGDLWSPRRAVARETAAADRGSRWTLHPAMVGILLAGLGVLLLGLTAFAQPNQ